MADGITAVALDLLRHKARRAPEGEAAEEAPMSERSEFGRRAASAEERRAPMQLHRIGARPGASGFGYFCRNKSDPLKAEAFGIGIIRCLLLKQFRA